MMLRALRTLNSVHLHFLIKLSCLFTNNMDIVSCIFWDIKVFVRIDKTPWKNSNEKSTGNPKTKNLKFLEENFSSYYIQFLDFFFAIYELCCCLEIFFRKNFLMDSLMRIDQICLIWAFNSLFCYILWLYRISSNKRPMALI